MNYLVPSLVLLYKIIKQLVLMNIHIDFNVPEYWSCSIFTLFKKEVKNIIAGYVINCVGYGKIYLQKITRR